MFLVCFNETSPGAGMVYVTEYRSTGTYTRIDETGYETERAALDRAAQIVSSPKGKALGLYLGPDTKSRYLVGLFNDPDKDADGY